MGKKKGKKKGKKGKGGVSSALVKGTLPYELHQATVLQSRCRSIYASMEGVIIADAARCRCTCKENLMRCVVLVIVPVVGSRLCVRGSWHK